MTVVKAEPSSDDLNSVQEVSHKKPKSGSSDGSHTHREALANKPVNQNRTESSKDKELQLRKFESFLLKPGQVPAGKESFTNSVKSEREQSKSPVRSAATQEDPIVREASESEKAPKKRTAHAKSLQSSKRIQLDEKFKELSNFVDDEEEIKESDNPGKYIKIDKLLYEPQEGENGSIFQELEQASEREFCTKAASWSLPEWIANGQHLLNDQTKLVGQLIKHRIELSLKFQVITQAVNDRAEALNAQDLLVDQKLQRIKTLGEEILHII